MKKSLISILIGLLIVGFNSSSWAEGKGPTARNVECNGCVNDTDIATTAITEPKLANGAVTNAKIADGAVTDAKILGVISGAKLGAHGHNRPLLHQAMLSL